MTRRLIATCSVGLGVLLVGGVAARQAPPPTPPASASSTTTSGSTTPPEDNATTPPRGRGGDPGAAIGAPPAMGVPPPAPTPNVGTGAISGVVTDAATGAPLEGAFVSLTGSGSPGQPLVNRPTQMTDSKGRFIFPNLAPSTAYSLNATRPGYLSGGYRRLPGMSSPDPIRLGDGEWFRDGHITLSRPGSISGTVRDERGEPFVGIPIRILVGATVAGHLRWASGPVTRTDDRGMYRFAGLSKGRYLVHVPGIQISLPSGEVALYRPPSRANTAGAAAQSQPRELLHVVREADGSGVVAGLFANAPVDDKGSVYASVFHPAARSVDQAEPIALEFGAERTGVDIQMTPLPSVSVSGFVAGPADAVAGIPVRILPVGNEQLGQAGDAGLTTTDANGRFTFHRIAAGDHVIVASRSVADFHAGGYGLQQPLLPVGANPFSLRFTNDGFGGTLLESLRMPGPDVVGRLEVNVGVRSLSGVVVPIVPTVSVSGHFEWDGWEALPPGAQPPRLQLEPADGDITIGPYPAARNAPALDTGRLGFTIQNVKPGRYMLEVWSQTHRFVGATWNGRDIIGSPLDVSGNAPIAGIVLRMSTQMNKVAGTVRGADGRVATEGAVIAFPPSPVAWRESGLRAIRFRTAGIAADGTYELPPMIPGEYLLAAISMEDRPRFLDPEFLDSIARQATRVSLGLASILSQDLSSVTSSVGQR